MYLHVGADTVVALRDVVAICDLELLQRSSFGREFMESIKDKLIKVGTGEAKSCVITSQEVILSSISSITLWRRAENPYLVAER